MSVTPIRTRRALDEHFDRMLREMQEDDSAHPTLGGFVGAVEAGIFVLSVVGLVVLFFL